ncbi:MAG: alpha-amylase family glycosyl hydrolase [Acutalibacteraceae bacterium]
MANTSRKFVAVCLVVAMMLSVLFIGSSSYSAANSSSEALSVSCMYGDINGDGKINSQDSLTIQKHIAKIMMLTGYKFTAADVNADGEITALDVLFIQKFMAKIISEFPAGEYYTISNTDWRTSTISYEIFVRSFCDSDGDGIGDFRGIASKASYLKDLNVGCVWLMPIHESPSYHGYDVIDYYSTNDDYGTIDDFKYMLSVLHQYDIKVLIDFVANHSSSQNQWFIDALSNPDSPYADYYEFTDEPDSTSGWRYNEKYDKYYRGNFSEGMPDLNYQNKAVWTEMENVAGYWLETGVDGFRLDASMLIDPDWDMTHEWWRDFESYVKSKNPDAFVVGENWTTNTDAVASFFNCMDSSFDFPLQEQIMKLAGGEQLNIVGFVNRELQLQKRYADTTPNVPKTSVMTTFLNNHDQTRTVSYLGSVEKAKLAAAIQLTLPGMPFIYYGEELGQLSNSTDPNRREAMDWYASAKGEGMCVLDEKFFGVPSKYTIPDDGISLEEEINDKNSIYNYYKKLTQLRTDYLIFFSGNYFSIESKSLNCYTVTDENYPYGMFVAHNVTESNIELNTLYDFTDLISGKSYKTGDTVTIAPYTTIVAKYDGIDKKYSLFKEIQSKDIPVTFNVTIPEKLPEGANVSIGTNMNGWNPTDTDWFMTKIDDLHYQLNVNLDSTYVSEAIEYKYTVQIDGQDFAWAHTEGDADGKDIGNRIYAIDYEDNVINDTVAMFKNGLGNTTVTSGTLETFTLDMPQYSDNRTRTIHVWLPEGYDSKNTDKKYPVFYMHDGQNLFDMYKSYAGEWMVDEAIADMMANGYEGAIIVGIENSADRWNEYSPEWDNVGSSLPNNSSAGDYAQFVDNPSGDKYGEFIVNTLKPYIDSHYNVRTDKNSTGIGGSSMGGLISYYIGMKYTDVFGQVLSFSPAFWMYSEDTIASVVDSYDYSNIDNLPKIFLYTGGANQMEKDTIPYVDLVYNKMTENVYPENKLNTLTDTTKDHNEAAWSEYFPLAFKWLVGFAA